MEKNNEGGTFTTVVEYTQWIRTDGFYTGHSVGQYAQQSAQKPLMAIFSYLGSIWCLCDWTTFYISCRRTRINVMKCNRFC